MATVPDGDHLKVTESHGRPGEHRCRPVATRAFAQFSGYSLCVTSPASGKYPDARPLRLRHGQRRVGRPRSRVGGVHMSRIRPSPAPEPPSVA
jgi:hypothetical protein